MEPINCDVVVVGAGFSGLAAAAAILKANPDLCVKVLEARSRVGGRVESMEGEVGVDVAADKEESTASPHRRTTGGDGNHHSQRRKRVRMDVGGAYVGPTQDRLLRMAREVGVTTYPVHHRPG